MTKVYWKGGSLSRIYSRINFMLVKYSWVMFGLVPTLFYLQNGWVDNVAHVYGGFLKRNIS